MLKTLMGLWLVFNLLTTNVPTTNVSRTTTWVNGETVTYYYVDGERVSEDYFAENYPRTYERWNRG